jgi:hypothetical protein
VSHPVRIVLYSSVMVPVRPAFRIDQPLSAPLTPPDNKKKYTIILASEDFGSIMVSCKTLVFGQANESCLGEGTGSEYNDCFFFPS